MQSKPIGSPQEQEGGLPQVPVQKTPRTLKKMLEAFSSVFNFKSFLPTKTRLAPRPAASAEVSKVQSPTPDLSQIKLASAKGPSLPFDWNLVPGKDNPQILAQLDRLIVYGKALAADQRMVIKERKDAQGFHYELVTVAYDKNFFHLLGGGQKSRDAVIEILKFAEKSLDSSLRAQTTKLVRELVNVLYENPAAKAIIEDDEQCKGYLSDIKQRLWAADLAIKEQETSKIGDEITRLRQVFDPNSPHLKVCCLFDKGFPSEVIRLGGLTFEQFLFSPYQSQDDEAIIELLNQPDRIPNQQMQQVVVERLTALLKFMKTSGLGVDRANRIAAALEQEISLPVERSRPSFELGPLERRKVRSEELHVSNRKKAVADFVALHRQLSSRVMALVNLPLDKKSSSLAADISKMVLAEILAPIALTSQELAYFYFEVANECLRQNDFQAAAVISKAFQNDEIKKIIGSGKVNSFIKALEDAQGQVYALAVKEQSNKPDTFRPTTVPRHTFSIEFMEETLRQLNPEIDLPKITALLKQSLLVLNNS